MKIQVNTTVEPLYGKVPRRLRRRLPIIDGYATRLISQYDVLEPGPHEPVLSIKPFVAFPYAAHFQKTSFATLDWAESAPEVRMLFYPAGSGYCELRLYVKGLHESDLLLDELGRIQTSRGKVQGGPGIRYYCRAVRVYSLYEVATVLLAASVLGFTVLLCYLTLVLAALTTLLSVVSVSSWLFPPPPF